MALSNLVKEYLDITNSIFGVYMDAVWGFGFLKANAIKQRKDTPAQNNAFMLIQPLLKPGTPPDFNNALHVATAEQVIERTKSNGSNSYVIGRMSLVLIYQYWEDNYRAKFAKNLGLDNKSKLKIDILGDIRNLRISIIHNNSIATSDTEKNKILRWFKREEPINITPQQLNEIKLYFQDNLLNDLEKEREN